MQPPRVTQPMDRAGRSEAALPGLRKKGKKRKETRGTPEAGVKVQGLGELDAAALAVREALQV